jgi:hypothetical protein
MMTEQIPTTWTGADEAFFGIVARAFSNRFAAGASVLLASYDQDGPLAVPVVHCAGRTEVPSPHRQPAARTTEARR